MPNSRQKCFGERAHGNARRGFPSAGPLQHVARLGKVVLDRACQVRVAGPRTGDRFALVLATRYVFDGQGFGPVLPVLVTNNDRDRRADGFRMPHARDNFDPICFNLHASAAAEALLAPPQLAIDGVERDRYAGGQTGERCNEALTVGFSGCFEAKHDREVTW